MKNILTILFAIIITHVTAQKPEQIHWLTEFSKPEHPFVLATSHEKKSADGARFMTERLIGYKNDNFSGGSWQENDSINYSYTGTNGIAYDAENTCDNLNNFDFVSNVLTFERRRTNTFDANNRLASYIEENWNGSSWDNSYKYIFSYNGSGFTTSYIQQEWLGAWENRYKSEYTYNTSDKTLSETSYSWNNAWKNETKSVYTYNANNFQTSYRYQTWVGNAWKDDYVYTTSYNTNQDITEILYQEDLGSGLENMDKTTYSYNANFQYIEIIQQVWVLSATWLNDKRYEYTYASNGEISTSVGSNWDSNLNIWVKNYRYTYTYDANKNKESDLRENWINNAWLNYSLYNFTYNAANKKTYEKYTIWDNNAWLNKNQSNYTFDANQMLLIDQRDNWVNNAWQGSSRYSYTYTAYGNKATYLYESGQSGTFVATSRSTFYYQNFDNGLSSIEEPNFSEYKLYPNPANSFVTIEFNTDKEELIAATIINVNGQSVASQNKQSAKGTNSLTFDTQLLPKGFYTIQLKSSTTQSIKKLMVN